MHNNKFNSSDNPIRSPLKFIVMSKGKDAKKDVKKAPTKTPKEKKAEKIEKKAAKKKF